MAFQKKALPQKITRLEKSPIGGLSNLKEASELETVMDQNFISHSYYLQPINDNRKLVIFHNGHDDNLSSGNGEKAIKTFLENGYPVLVLYMPLFGPNTGPVAPHNDLPKLNSEKLNFIELFLDPIATSLNYLNKKYSYSSISMVGLSGGGWTTVLYSAIDTRITKSVQIAASLPSYLQQGPCKEPPADAEQSDPELYKIASYSDLYIMSSYGPNRYHLQILNKYDPCCAYGIRYKIYENTIKTHVSGLKKGVFEIFEDNTHTDHVLSQHSLEKVILPILSSQN